MQAGVSAGFAENALLRCDQSGGIKLEEVPSAARHERRLYSRRSTLGVYAAASIEMSGLFLRINVRCDVRNATPLAYRPLRKEDVADGLLCWRPADRVSMNKV